MLKKIYNSGLWYVRLYMLVLDVIFYPSALFYKKNSKENVEKLLLCNGAHLGDVLYVLSVAHFIKQQRPSVKIGMLCGSWTVNLVKACHDIDEIHPIDHWKMNRNNVGMIDKWKKYIKSYVNAFLSVRRMKYDAVIDTYIYYPNFSLLFLMAGIGRRIGYNCHGNAYLLTDSVEWRCEDKHIYEYQINLSKQLGLRTYKNISFYADFGELPVGVMKKLSLKKDNYIVVAIGSGSQRRQWSLDRWIEVIRFVINNGYIVTLTGYGRNELDQIEEIMKKVKSPLLKNFCNELSLMEFFCVIKEAKLFIGGESFAGHVAAMYKVPQISIMHGASNKYQWRPYGNDKCVVIRKKMNCSPCYSENGCKNNNICMNIETKQVLDAIIEFGVHLNNH